MHSNFRIQNLCLETYYCYYIPILPKQEMNEDNPERVEAIFKNDGIPNPAESRPKGRRLQLGKCSVILKKIDQCSDPYFEAFLRRNPSKNCDEMKLLEASNSKVLGKNEHPKEKAVPKLNLADRIKIKRLKKEEVTKKNVSIKGEHSKENAIPKLKIKGLKKEQDVKVSSKTEHSKEEAIPKIKIKDLKREQEVKEDKFSSKNEHPKEKTIPKLKIKNLKKEEEVKEAMVSSKDEPPKEKAMPKLKIRDLEKEQEIKKDKVSSKREHPKEKPIPNLKIKSLKRKKKGNKCRKRMAVVRMLKLTKFEVETITGYNFSKQIKQVIKIEKKKQPDTVSKSMKNSKAKEEKHHHHSRKDKDYHGKSRKHQHEAIAAINRLREARQQAQDPGMGL